MWVARCEARKPPSGPTLARRHLSPEQQAEVRERQRALALLKRLPSPRLESALYTAWRRTVRFFDNFYVDLHHFAGNLAAASNQREVRQACRNVQAVIEGRGARSPILAEGHLGARMKPVRGLSIYFPPFRDPSAFYRELDFAHRTRWADFLDVYLGEEVTKKAASLKL